MKSKALILGLALPLLMAGGAWAQAFPGAVAGAPAGAPLAPAAPRKAVRHGPSKAEIGLRRSLAGARAENETLKAAAAQSQAETAQLRQQLEQAQGALHALQAQDDELKSTLASTSSTLEACKVKNVELIKLGNEVLDRYKKVDLDDVLGAKEPFTGLKRVQLQNIAQGYEDRLYAGRYDPRRDKAPPEPARPKGDVTEPSSH